MNKYNIEIKTERLLLRPLNINDLEYVHEYSSDETLTKYMLYLPNYTKDETLSVLKNAEKNWNSEKLTSCEFAIILDGKVIGDISVSRYGDDDTADLGWIINPKYQGKGYATEAALAVKDFGLNILKYKKLIAQCDARNTASWGLMKKLGMKLDDDTATRINKGDTEEVKELKYSVER